MKHFKDIIIPLIIAVFMLYTAPSRAQSNTEQTRQESLLAQMDSVEISLLTCGPGKEIYSLYGHTAIRFTDKALGSDLAINYGMFSFQQEFFIPRFILGLTDYEMGICPMDMFIAEYQYEGRWVKEQKLSLTREDKLLIAQAIDTNYRPENKVYRYNYFYDNCTTRARDLIVNHLKGEQIDYHFLQEKEKNPTTYRNDIHQYNIHEPWARFANDALLGAASDLRINDIQQQFLPNKLMDDFSRATIGNGKDQRKFVENESWLIPPTQKMTDDNPFFRPITCAWCLFILTLLVTIVEWRKKKCAWGYDLALLVLTGIAGLLPAIMFFSAHPTVNTNIQLTILNPLPLFCVYSVIKKERKNGRHWFWKLEIALVTFFLIGGFFQSYAEGMYLLALSLLVRSIANIRR